MTGKSREGRPPKYTEDQVAEAIKIVEAAGDQPDGNAVKAVLCQEFGVSKGINAQSLGEEVKRQLEELKRKEREGLVASLSPEARAAATKVGKDLENRFLECLGQQAKDIRSEADRVLAAKEEDCAALRAKVRDLREEVAEKTARGDRLAEEKAALEEQLEKATQTIANLEAEIAARARDEAFKAELIAMLKDTLAQPEAGKSVQEKGSAAIRRQARA